ncbi:MAG: arginine--tRNA ligase [Candidatus Alcyoniella australis]|nr:arginine--tRNA ligase [Candidatus Alcyoniella australis]
MKTEVVKLINAAIAAAQQDESLPPGDTPQWEISVPKEAGFGDLSCNVAFKLAKQARRAPRDVAQSIIDHLPDNALLRRAEVAGAGFINLFTARDALAEQLTALEAAGAGFGRIDLGKGLKVNIEFVSANPTGPLHVGHGRNAAVGDAAARVLEAAGYDVVREYYVNDTGVQIRNLGRTMLARCRELAGEQIELDQDMYHGEYVIELAKQLREQRESFPPTDDELDAVARWAADRLLQRIKDDLEQFRVPIDVWSSERTMVEAGEVDRALGDLEQHGHMFDQDGAKWFASTRWGDDKDRVVTKSDGSRTYFASDIAYHRDKFERGFDRLIDVWGADHHGYVPRMRSACAALGHDPDDFQVMLIQMVRLMREGQEVKMSKRSGEFETLADVVSEVGVDAARTIILSRRHDAHLDFDLDLAVKKTLDNPVYYIQYMHARICSVFAKAVEAGLTIPSVADVDPRLLQTADERQLIKTILSLPDAVASAARELEPHRITAWLQSLAGQFHPWYAGHRIISDDPELTAARLLMCKLVKQVTANALALIGVSAPERM